ncbi:MAG TPA: glycosyl hydrolase family 28 protein [Bacteroidota bacterium]|nr:glycosyl hydrolase family 28 protein [Bacteroidota bacterium]
MRPRTVAALAAAASLIFVRPSFPQSGSRESPYTITGFGAKPDGKTVNTDAIQSAVNRCNAQGGGTVAVPPGEFITGAIRLLSNVHLYLESGALLKGSSDISDYYRSGIRRGVLYADDAVDITVSGPGCIDGNGSGYFRTDRLNSPGIEKMYTRQKEDYMNPKYGLDEGPIAYERRPGMMVDFLRCSDISLRDVTLRDSPEYALRIGSCENVTVAGITVANNPLIPNNDGIHCTTSRNVRISDCHIVAGDDAIIVTGFPYDMDSTGRGGAGPAAHGNKTGRAEYVTVTNCTLSSRSAGIRVGYGDNDIRDCAFQNIVIENSNRGIGVFARDRGSIGNILFSNIIIETRLFTGGWWGAGEPIHVSALPQDKGGRIGRITGITFDNIIAESEAGIVLYGAEESPLAGIVLNNVRLTVRNGPLTRSYGGNIDLRPVWSGKMRVFGHDLSGIYARNLTDSRVEHFDLIWAGDLPAFFTNGIELDHSRDIVIRGFHGNQAPGARDARPIKTGHCTGIRVEK